MKNLKTTLVLIGVLWYSSVLYGQAPGFMGRKNIIHADFFVIHRFGQIFFPDPNTTFSSKFRTTKGVGYERVLSRRSLIGVDIDLSRNKNQNAYEGGVPGTMVVNAWGLGLRFRSYPFLRKGWIAPLGPYFGWSLRPMLVTKKFNPDGGGPNTQFPVALTGSIGFITGKTFPLSSRLLMDLGVRCSLTDVINYSKLGWSGDEHREYLYTSDLIKLHIALSFLP